MYSMPNSNYSSDLNKTWLANGANERSAKFGGVWAKKKIQIPSQSFNAAEAHKACDPNTTFTLSSGFSNGTSLI